MRAAWLALSLMVAGAAASATAQTRVGGFVELDQISYFRRPDVDKVNGRTQGILQLELRHRAGSAAAFGAVELRTDQADPGRRRVFLDEAWVALYIGPLDIRAGKQIYAWGRADAFNPTDFSAWDFRDLLDTEDEKLGLVSVRMDYYVGAWMLEGMVAPAFAASVLPDVDSRWWGGFPDSVANPRFPAQGPERLAAIYRLGDAVRPDEGLPSTQYGLRLSGTLGGWDLALSWFDGIDDLPGIRARTAVDTATGTADVVLIPRHDRRRAFGGDVATTVGPVGLHAEAAYFLTADWRGTDAVVDDPYLQYVLGLDYTVDRFVAGNDLFVLAEWIHEIPLPDRGVVYRATDLNHLFRRTLVGKADLDLGEFMTVGAAGLWNLASRDWVVSPRFEWSVADGAEIDARLDLLGGPPDSFFGTFRDNRRAQLRLKYTF